VSIPPLTNLSEDERLLFDSVLEFAEREIAPRVREMDEQAKFPKDLIPKLFDLGVMGIEVPESLGGSGATFVHSVLAVEALARVDASVAVLVDVQNTLVINAVTRWGSDEIKARSCRSWRAAPLAPTPSRSRFRQRCLRAADAGRRVWRRVHADRPEAVDHQRARGGPVHRLRDGESEAGYRGITAFIVERGTPGFSVGKKEDKLGIRASSTCELLFEQCHVSRANVLGDVGKGYKVAIETLNEGRIGIGAQMLGIAQAALDHAIRYTKERKQFGKAVAEFQGVQFELARAAMEVEAARLLVYNAARLRDAGRPFLTEAAMCKLHASEVAERVGVAGGQPVRRLRIREGLPCREAVSRRKDRADLRGDDEPATADDRESAAGVTPRTPHAFLTGTKNANNSDATSAETARRASRSASG
jgi:alkylation response protein AidB-like acyl-CoA dehydrogenase